VKVFPDDPADGRDPVPHQNPYLRGYAGRYVRSPAPPAQGNGQPPPPAPPEPEHPRRSWLPLVTLIVGLIGASAAAWTGYVLDRTHQSSIAAEARRMALERDKAAVEARKIAIEERKVAIEERKIELQQQANEDFQKVHRGEIQIADGMNDVNSGKALIESGRAKIRDGRAFNSNVRRRGARTTTRAVEPTAWSPQSGSVVETSLRHYRVVLQGVWSDEERRQMKLKWAGACGIASGAIEQLSDGYEFDSRGCVPGTFDGLSKQ
jgi:hypothetical protein